MTSDLSGKRIIVTGAATGIGRATTLRVSASGAKVAAFDINDADGAATISDVNESGGDARYWHVDVRDETAVSGAVAAGSMVRGSGCINSYCRSAARCSSRVR